MKNSASSPVPTLQPRDDFANVPAMTMTSKLWAAGVGVGLLLGAGEAEAVSFCSRTQNLLSLCEVKPILSDWRACSEAGSQPCTEEEEATNTCEGIPWNDWVFYNNWRYNDPASDLNDFASSRESLLNACDKYYQKVPYEGDDLYEGDLDVNISFTGQPPYTTGYCILLDIPEESCSDWNDEGSGWCEGTTVIVNGGVQRDEICDRVPNGSSPYFDLAGGGGTDGAPYSTPQKKKIRGTNAYFPDHNGALWTDVGTHNHFPQIVSTPPEFPRPLGSGQDYFKVLTHVAPYIDLHSAEVDHIIPAKDSKGCKCGKNSNANAALISRRLNGEMGNNQRHAVRKLMLQRWTTAP